MLAAIQRRFKVGWLAAYAIRVLTDLYLRWPARPVVSLMIQGATPIDER